MDNIHDLEKIVENTKIVLLIITDGVFERPFIQLELRTALKYNKKIITLWDKDRCPIYPKKDNLPDDISKILDIKSYKWILEKKHRNLIINEIIEKIKEINTIKENIFMIQNKIEKNIIQEMTKDINNNRINPVQINNLSEKEKNLIKENIFRMKSIYEKIDNFLPIFLKLSSNI